MMAKLGTFMSSPLYYGEFLSKKGAVVHYRLTIVHPDVSELGRDARFAWRLLSDWISPDEVEADDAANAHRYIKNVELSAVRGGTVVKRAADHLRVQRAGDAQPSVVYRITVTDPKLLTGIKKGDADEVYQFVDVARPAAKPRSKPVGATAPKTYDDLRTYALELVRGNAGSGSDTIVHDLLLEWAAGACDADVERWLGYLAPAWAATGAGLVAVQRERANKHASAKTLLAFAEAKLAKTKKYDRGSGLTGVVAARWRLGKAKEAEEAEAAFRARLADAATEHRDGEIAALILMAAAGQQPARIAEVLGHPAFADLDGELRDAMVVAVVELLADGNVKTGRILLDAWTKHRPDRSPELTDALVRHFAHDPADYFELLLAYPEILDGRESAPLFAELARREPKVAVRVALRILDDASLRSCLGAAALEVLATRAPDRLGAHAKTREPGELAALGRTKQALVALPKVTEVHVAREIAVHAAAPALAIAALKRAIECSSDPDPRCYVPLAKLGEASWVAERLATVIAELRTKSPAQRDLPCRGLAQSAAEVGLVELAFAAAKLPTAAMRPYSAEAMVDGFARTGDFTNALAALELVPDDGPNGRVRAAVDVALRAAREGQRAYRLRVTDALET